MGFAKEDLFKPRHSTPTGMPEDDVTVPGLGTFHVRGLNRLEAMHVQATDNPAERERRAIALAVIGPFTLTEPEVRRWQVACVAGEMTDLAEKITALSGMADGADKDAMRDFEESESLEFRVLPGAETQDDGSDSSGGNE